MDQEPRMSESVYATVEPIKVRTRASYGPRLYRALTLPLVVGGEFFTTRKMLYGIKRRVEGVGYGSGPNIEASQGVMNQ
jgi:hypothetical protein